MLFKFTLPNQVNHFLILGSGIKKLLQAICIYRYLHYYSSWLLDAFEVTNLAHAKNNFAYSELQSRVACKI